MSIDYDQAVIACALAELAERLETTGLPEDVTRPRELLAEAEAGNLVVGPDPEFGDLLDRVRQNAIAIKFDFEEVGPVCIVQELAAIATACRMPEQVRTRLAGLIVCLQARIDHAAWQDATQALTDAAASARKH
jgi:hypothetical protein